MTQGKWELKAALYRYLINQPYERTTDSDVNLMFELSKDPDIQAHLKERIRVQV